MEKLKKTSIATKQLKSKIKADASAKMNDLAVHGTDEQYKSALGFRNKLSEMKNEQAHQITAPLLNPKTGSRPESQVEILSPKNRSRRQDSGIYSKEAGYGPKDEVHGENYTRAGSYIPGSGNPVKSSEDNKIIPTGKGWAETPRTQIHEGFHHLIDKIEDDSGNNGFDRRHRASGVFLSALSDKIHPSLFPHLVKNLRDRDYHKLAQHYFPKSKEKQAQFMLNELIASTHDLMNGEDARKSFFTRIFGKHDPNGGRQKNFMNKLKSSFKGMQQFAKKATWDDIKAHRPKYEMSLSRHKILDEE